MFQGGNGFHSIVCDFFPKGIAWKRVHLLHSHYICKDLLLLLWNAVHTISASLVSYLCYFFPFSFDPAHWSHSFHYLDQSVVHFTGIFCLLLLDSFSLSKTALFREGYYFLTL